MAWHCNLACAGCVIKDVIHMALLEAMQRSEPYF